jgi:competence protein ComEA
MNTAERNFLYLALFLFALGGVSRSGIFDKLSPFESISLPVNNEFVAVADSIVVDSAMSIDTLVDEFTSKSKKTKAPKKKAPAFPINVNTASFDDLCFIKGVGPSLAQKIIDHRENKGSFRSAKDLEKVSGIGAKKRQAIEEFVKFD